MSLDQKPVAKKSWDRSQPVDVGRDREMGDAWRSVYDKAVQESVPDEMLDLLSKLD